MDQLKGFLTCLVVIGHIAIDYYNNNFLREGERDSKLLAFVYNMTGWASLGIVGLILSYVSITVFVNVFKFRIKESVILEFLGKTHYLYMCYIIFFSLL